MNSKLDDEERWVAMLIVTTFGRSGYLRRAMEAGALGFIVKDAPADQLADAVRRVARGERVVDPALVPPRWRRGESVDGTVRNYLSSAISKTGTRNRVEALRVADDNGWL